MLWNFVKLREIVKLARLRGNSETTMQLRGGKLTWDDLENSTKIDRSFFALHFSVFCVLIDSWFRTVCVAVFWLRDGVSVIHSNSLRAGWRCDAKVGDDHVQGPDRPDPSDRGNFLKGTIDLPVASFCLFMEALSWKIMGKLDVQKLANSEMQCMHTEKHISTADIACTCGSLSLSLVVCEGIEYWVLFSIIQLLQGSKSPFAKKPILAHKKRALAIFSSLWPMTWADLWSGKLESWKV